MESLLAKLDEHLSARPDMGPRVPVVMPVALDQTYDYLLPPGIEAGPGSYVLVPFGPQTRIGVVWDGPAGDPGKLSPDKKLKAISECLTEIPPLPELSLRFAEWVARYTLTPLGMVVRMMMGPSSIFEPVKPRFGVRRNPDAPEPPRMTPARKRALQIAADGLIRAKSALAAETGCSTGVIDGLVACCLVARVRTDFKVLAHVLLARAEEVRPFLLPIDFEETKAALETNIKTRAEAKTLLENGGALIIFPGGTVSTTPTVLARKARDPEWKTFTARMIVQGKAPVVPVFFAGQNSRLFQVASHVSMTLRLSLLFKEVHDRIGSDLTLRIGKRIPYEELKAISDRKKLMEFLRDKTYALEDLVPKKSKRRSRRRELIE